MVEYFRAELPIIIEVLKIEMYSLFWHLSGRQFHHVHIYPRWQCFLPSRKSWNHSKWFPRIIFAMAEYFRGEFPILRFWNSRCIHYFDILSGLQFHNVLIHPSIVFYSSPRSHWTRFSSFFIVRLVCLLVYRALEALHRTALLMSAATFSGTQASM